jgi:hypothetical protein
VSGDHGTDVFLRIYRPRHRIRLAAGTAFISVAVLAAYGASGRAWLLLTGLCSAALGVTYHLWRRSEDRRADEAELALYRRWVEAVTAELGRQ